MNSDSDNKTENNDAHGDSAHGADGGRAKPRYDDVNVPVVVLIGFISAVVTFITIAFVQGVWAHWSKTFVDNTPNPAIMNALNEQKDKLQANPETGRLSIEETMSAVAEQFAQPGESPETEHGDDSHGDDSHGDDAHGDDAHEDDSHGDDADGNAGHAATGHEVGNG